MTRMTRVLTVDETVGLLDFLEDQEQNLNYRLPKAIGKKVTLMQFSTDDFDLVGIRAFVDDVHRGILPTARKNMVKEATRVQGTLTSHSLQLVDASLTVIPWNNTLSRYESAKTFEFGFSVAFVSTWTYASYRRVPCITFEDALNKMWHVLRFDDMPFDGLD